MHLKSNPQKMHVLYCRLTGFEVPWSMDRLFAWEIFCSKFDESDLRKLIEFIHAKSKRGHPARSLTWRNLIGGPESVTFAEEDLAEAKALDRQPKPTPKDNILYLTGRPPPDTSKAQPVAAVMAQHALMAQLLKGLRESL